MSGFVRASDRIIAVLVALGLSLGAADAAPARVVSVNLCTDQLAMLLAAPGQLISVSTMAIDPLSSAMVEQARGYTLNRGQAEQVFLMHPDLVLAGTYTARASVDLLRQLGVEVIQLPPVMSLAEVIDQLRVVGTVLGRAAEAEAMIARFQSDIETLRSTNPHRPSAAMYFPNGYTSGAGTIANEILELTGFSNVGATAGLTGGGTLPLERLVMAQPDLVVTSTPYPGASRSEEILTHPALATLRTTSGQARVTDADWVCGTPYMLRAVAAMAEARRALEAEE